ncbi:hypothetical protein, partial [Lampropedia aestuarii]|uniref:hypothetical protein n=1 Tax=Lampropedia aestuarii TaxID=2562762 RepID=UPI00198188B2
CVCAWLATGMHTAAKAAKAEKAEKVLPMQTFFTSSRLLAIPLVKVCISRWQRNRRGQLWSHRYLLWCMACFRRKIKMC